MVLLLACLFVFPAVKPIDAAGLGKAELSNLVKRAYVYAYPLYRMYLTFYDDTWNRQYGNREDINVFHHDRFLADHTFRDFTAPNDDTPPSKAWLELLKEPVIPAVPAVGDRCYVLGLMDFYTKNYPVTETGWGS